MTRDTIYFIPGADYNFNMTHYTDNLRKHLDHLDTRLNIRQYKILENLNNDIVSNPEII